MGVPLPSAKLSIFGFAASVFAAGLAVFSAKNSGIITNWW
jgi:hypothetical protein